MSRVKDLEIRGIRNFGDEKAKVRIRFSKPLTLILGPNGTGKTTIIESLKYITSGEYPPDSERGKSFVHEPKLTLNHTVRGQVKARILDKKGQELIITRTMQVSRQKNSSLKFSALDNLITRYDENKKPIQISSRCADVDREMLIAMGVSKPILNYVIFCHQEESNWPLEDGKKLKDRFDEIFDTSKYNKAMDTTTRLIKDLQAELKTIEAYEDGLKNMVEEVENLEEKLNDCETREEKGSSRMQKIDQSIKPIEKRSDEIIKVKEDYDKLMEQIKLTESEYKIINSKINSLKQHVKHIFKGSQSELIRKIEAHDTNYSQKSQSKRQIETDLEDIQKVEKALVIKLEEAKIQVGSLRQKKHAFDEKIMSRNNLLTKSLKTWNLADIDQISSENEASDFIEQLDAKLKELADSMKRKFQENEQEEKYVQREVDKFRIGKTEIESEMSLKEKERQDISLEITDLKNKINMTGEAEKKLNFIESDLQKATKIYDDLVQNCDEESIHRNLQTELSNKKELNVKLINIDCEIKSLHQQSSQQAELELHQSDLKKKEEQILHLQNKYKDDLESLFGKNIPETGLKQNLEKLQFALTTEKADILKNIEKEQKKVTELETALKYNQSEIKKINSELEDYREKISMKCQGNDYNEILKLQEKKVKSLQDERGIYANQSVMYEKYINQLKAKSCCPLCERGFQSSSDEKRLEKKLILEIEKSPESLQKCEEELKVEQTRYDELLQLKPNIEQIREIEESKLPKLRQAEQKRKSDLETSKEILDDLKLTLVEPDEKLSTYKNIFGEIILLDNCINEKQRINRLIESKKLEMSKAGKIGDRSMEEAQNARDAIRKRVASVESKIESIQFSLRECQEKVQKAREYKNKLNEEVLKIRQNMQELKQLQDKRRGLIDKDSTLEESIKSLRQKLVMADNALSEKVTELNELKRRNRDEYDKDSEFKTKRSTELHELKTIQHEVKRFTGMKIDETLGKIQSESDQIKKDCDDKKNERLNLEEQIRTLEELCRSQERRKQEMEDNLELMKLEDEVEKLNEQIAKDKVILQDLRYSELKQEFIRLQKEKDQYEEEKNSIKGALGEMRNTISKLKKDLNQEKYRMARSNFKRKQCELMVQKQAIENLKTYVTVLDKAMIQFHEERMNTVNHIMHQLWSLVYSGNDTSSIQIRVQTTEGIGDKKRSYNYKLVQVKRSTEMDMKGKCSAGQKVLASIIIRMALADTFCSDCSVLALDEPTTNLDEENAQNLACMLSKVIQLRAQHNKSFQLIVISHDERFISQLSTLNGKQWCQELYRNIDGYSLVKLRDVSDASKTSSQNMTDGKFELDSDDEEDDDCVGNDFGEPGPSKVSLKNSRKRQVSPDDSPPRRATKRRA